jgi:hypothetical protein
MVMYDMTLFLILNGRETKCTYGGSSESTQPYS